MDRFDEMAIETLRHTGCVASDEPPGRCWECEQVADALRDTDAKAREEERERCCRVLREKADRNIRIANEKEPDVPASAEAHRMSATWLGEMIEEIRVMRGTAAIREAVRVSETFAGKTPGWAPLRAVSAVTGVPVHRIIGTSRSAKKAEARLAVMHLLDRRGMSHGDIADVIRRERSTVSSHLRKPAPTELIDRAERLLARIA